MTRAVDPPTSKPDSGGRKYCPEFPDRFGCFEDALALCHGFFTYYNTQHRHAGIALMTPYAVHHGLAPQLHDARQQTLLAAYARNPERFVRKSPTPPALPEAAWINPPEKNSTLKDRSRSSIITPETIGGSTEIKGLELEEAAH